MLYDKLVETAKAQAAVVTPEEESDMEASDVEDDVPNVNSDSLPLGTTFRTIHVLQNQTQNSQPNLVTEPKPTFMPRKLSTISSQDRESIPNIEEETEFPEVDAPEVESENLKLPPEMEEDEEENLGKTTEAEVHAKLLNQTDFEWHPDEKTDNDNAVMGASGVTGLPCPSSVQNEDEEGKDPESEALLPSKSSEIDTKNLPSTSVQPARIGSRYKNTHV